MPRVSTSAFQNASYVRSQLNSICAETTDIATILELTQNEDARIRLRALKELCPCRVKDDIDLFWDRILAMTNDPDAAVRGQVLHTLCDGSPAHREDDIINAVEQFNGDSDKDIRRRAHKVLGHYRRTGKWNIL
eukprot:GILI01005287.1.p1 GENE.GILI01005287.1~~GILI01005287.1.p1  ORF type:complete len:143 (+),score=40.81 GILI01005287.1:29-430(+)